MTRKIEAIVREEKLADVREALHQLGIVGLNVTEVRGHGKQGSITVVGRKGRNMAFRHKTLLGMAPHGFVRQNTAQNDARRSV